MSGYLLDTHVVIWCFINDPTLSPQARQTIVNPDNDIFVSAVSAWEITIKKALGKLSAPENFEEEVSKKQFTPLNITIRHALTVGTLPQFDDHKDPFDRLLIAQTKLEGLTLITRDRRMSKYRVPIVIA